MEQPVLGALVSQPLPPRPPRPLLRPLPCSPAAPSPDADLPDPHSSQQRCSHETATDKTVTRRNSAAPSGCRGLQSRVQRGRLQWPGVALLVCSVLVGTWGHSALAWVQKAFVCSCGCSDQAERRRGLGEGLSDGLWSAHLSRIGESDSSRAVPGAQSH